MSALKRLVHPYLLSMRTSIGKPAPIEEVRRFLAYCQPYRTEHCLVRVGGDEDGGYLIPDDLDGIEGCFSPGVAQTATFEAFFVDRNVPCYLADASIERSPLAGPLVKFERAFIGLGGQTNTLRLTDWIQENAPETDNLILQMDIEGSEYEVILDTDEDILNKFRIIAVEFHNFHFLYDRMGFHLIRAALFKILKHFTIVHLHPNNCARLARYKDVKVPPVLEATFLRNDRVDSRTPAMKFPHDLDRPNVRRRKNIVLPESFLMGNP